MNRLRGFHFTITVVILLFPLSSSTRTPDHTGGSSTSPSIHIPKAEAHFRMHTEEVLCLHCVGRTGPNSVGSATEENEYPGALHFGDGV